MFTRYRRSLVLFAGLAGVMGAAPWAMSQGLAAAGLKVGFVNSVEVLQGTDEGRQKLGGFQQWAEARQKELQQDKTELDRLREQFAAQERTLNPDTRTEMMRTIEDRDRRLRRKQEDSQLESESRNRQMLEQVGTKIQTIISEYAQQNGLFRHLLAQREPELRGSLLGRHQGTRLHLQSASSGGFLPDFVRSGPALAPEREPRSGGIDAGLAGAGPASIRVR